MKKLVIGTTLAAVLAITGAPAFAASEATTAAPATKSGVATMTVDPETSYNYSVPNFNLVKGEHAWTTRSNYGFTLEEDFLHPQDSLRMTFDVANGATGTTLKIWLFKLSDYNNNKAKIEGNSESANDNLAVKYSSHITGNGTGRTVSFNTLPAGTYVFYWKNIGTPSFDVRNAKVTSY